MELSRRDLMKRATALGAAAVMLRDGEARSAAAPDHPPAIGFGLVTYQWGRDWDVPTLVENCTVAKTRGVELRTTHAHGVEPSLDAEQRHAVRRRFEDSPVRLVGLGTVQDFHTPDPNALEQSIDLTRAFIKLGHDVGGSGVKVRPNDLPKEVAPEKTIEQIGRSLNTLAAFGADYGQQFRLEVHGGCAKLPVIQKIMEVATHPNVGVCWNCNETDLDAPGLEANFDLVKHRLGATTHVHPFHASKYPYQQLLDLYVKAGYTGWWLLEADGKDPADRVKALAEQKALFDQMLAEATA